MALLQIEMRLPRQGDALRASTKAAVSQHYWHASGVGCRWHHARLSWHLQRERGFFHNSPSNRASLWQASSAGLVGRVALAEMLLLPTVAQQPTEVGRWCWNVQKPVGSRLRLDMQTAVGLTTAAVEIPAPRAEASNEL